MKDANGSWLDTNGKVIDTDGMTTVVMIAPDFGEWTRGTELGAVLTLLKKRIGARKGKKTIITMFLSDAPVDIETDIYVRVFAAKGAKLTKHQTEINL